MTQTRAILLAIGVLFVCLVGVEGRGSLFTVPTSSSPPSYTASAHNAGSIPIVASSAHHELRSASGNECAICVIGVSLLQQFAFDSNQSLATAANQWCAFITNEINALDGLCQTLIQPVVAELENDFANLVSPDVSCQQTLNRCSQAQCKLYSIWPPPPSSQVRRVGEIEDKMDETSVEMRHGYYAEVASRFMNIRHINKEMKSIMKRKLKQFGTANPAELNVQGHWLPKPIPDWDQDGYASSWTYRGLQFRGADCNDQSANVFPGRNALNGGDFDATADSNCNGISGVDGDGIPYEKKFCSETPSRGLLAIGDSATAHFALPPSYITPKGFNMSTYESIVELLFTELDWAQCSSSTGWRNTSDCPYSPLPMNSIYQRMLRQNQCMHRDYVNAGVNGQSIDNLAPDQPVVPSNYSGNLEAIPARFATEGPSTVIYALIGNDICRAHHDDGYTPLDVFFQKALAELRYLDTKLYPGSNVIVVGVIDGRVLYDTLADKMHPLGATYTQVYDFLNCIGISPCWGWMNSNSTIRDASSARAADYNLVWQNLIATETFMNFKINFWNADMKAIIQKWVQDGNDATLLIEPVDGFHPSQTANMLIAENLWNFLSSEVPDAIGMLNPNNDQIIQVFGDQGGYGYPK